MQGLVHQNKDFELLLWGFPGGSNGKKSACNAGDLSFIPGSGRLPGEGNGNPLQYSCLEDSMDKRAWQTAVHGVKRSLSPYRKHYKF